jgi:PII-like signaling protein
MGLSGSVKKLSAYIGDADTYDDKPMYEAMLEQARVQGCAGATVLRGVAGYGATSREEEKHGMKMSVDLPLVVQVVDRADKVTALAEVYSAMIGAGLVTIENVNVLVYRGGDKSEA